MLPALLFSLLSTLPLIKSEVIAGWEFCDLLYDSGYYLMTHSKTRAYHSSVLRILARLKNICKTKEDSLDECNF